MKLTRGKNKMTHIQKVDLKSKDIKSEQIERLKTIFPEVVADGKINFEQLKATLGEDLEDSKERFGMMWAGKNKCFRIIQDPSTGTLKPSRNESVNFDTTENLFIEGDNLEVLKLLQKSYYEKVKMIYIDPPYNTGNDFVYPDNFGQQLEEYLKMTGQVDSEGNKLSTNTDSNGRFHSAWLNMMYPRLFLARNMLTNDGVIFISIDDNEVHNLKTICNEIFGEQNFVASISNITGASQNGEGVKIQKNKEECLVYCKDQESFMPNKIDEADDSLRNLNDAPSELKTRPDMGYTIYYNPNTEEIIPRKDYDKSKIHLNKEELVYSNDEELIKKGFVPIRPGIKNKLLHRWRWGFETFQERINEIIIKKTKDEYRAYFKQTGMNPPKNIMNFIVGTSELKSLFEDVRIFDFPKSTKMIKYLIKIGSNPNDIILDFFAGSGTTAHAILELNKEEESHRKFICIQLPEPIDESSEANKAGYKNIAEISKERIRRVIKEIEKESKQQKIVDKKHDFGFRVFKLDRSNFKNWDNQTSELQTSLNEHVDQIKKSSNPEDVLYEILIKEGMPLTTHVKKIKVDEKEVFSIDNNMLLICLEEKLSKELFKEIKKLNPQIVIVLDSGFKNNDQLKTNAVELMTYVDIDTGRKEYILRSI